MDATRKRRQGHGPRALYYAQFRATRFSLFMIGEKMISAIKKAQNSIHVSDKMTDNEILNLFGLTGITWTQRRIDARKRTTEQDRIDHAARVTAMISRAEQGLPLYDGAEVPEFLADIFPR